MNKEKIKKLLKILREDTDTLYSIIDTGDRNKTVQESYEMIRDTIIENLDKIEGEL
jgi:hypothetical protein